jgi:PleD family two-component response regulator
MKSVLVVDDNVSVLKQVSAILEGSYDFFLAKSGAMALKICDREYPDLILLDIAMPEMDGFETLARFKAIDRLVSVPVIFLSGFDDKTLTAKALEAGAVDIIVKPAERDFLLRRIAFHLRCSVTEAAQ